jgi:hypothetical protein
LSCVCVVRVASFFQRVALLCALITTNARLKTKQQPPPPQPTDQTQPIVRRRRPAQRMGVLFDALRKRVCVGWRRRARRQRRRQRVKKTGARLFLPRASQITHKNNTITPSAPLCLRANPLSCQKAEAAAGRCHRPAAALSLAPFQRPAGALPLFFSLRTSKCFFFRPLPLRRRFAAHRPVCPHHSHRHPSHPSPEAPAAAAPGPGHRRVCALRGHSHFRVFPAFAWGRGVAICFKERLRRSFPLAKPARLRAREAVLSKLFRKCLYLSRDKSSKKNSTQNSLRCNCSNYKNARPHHIGRPSGRTSGGTAMLLRCFREAGCEDLGSKHICNSHAMQNNTQKQPPPFLAPRTCSP